MGRLRKSLKKKKKKKKQDLKQEFFITKGAFH
jgi:hypothetical protein